MPYFACDSLLVQFVHEPVMPDCVVRFANVLEKHVETLERDTGTVKGPSKLAGDVACLVGTVARADAGAEAPHAQCSAWRKKRLMLSSLLHRHIRRRRLHSELIKSDWASACNR